MSGPMSGHLENLVLTAVSAGFLSWGGFQTFLVLHSFGLTVILNNQLELVAAASHLLEGFLLAAASCLCWCSWTRLPCGQAEIQRNPLYCQGRDAPVHKLSWNESDWRCDWIIEQWCSSPEQRGSEVQYQLGGLAVEISPKLRLWWCARVSGSANSCQNKALSAYADRDILLLPHNRIRWWRQSSSASLSNQQPVSD